MRRDFAESSYLLAAFEFCELSPLKLQNCLKTVRREGRSGTVREEREREAPMKGSVERSRHERHFRSLLSCFYFIDFKFSKFVCPSELHPLMRFFFKNSFRKKKSIRKTALNTLAHSIFALEVEIWTKNLQKCWFTLPGRL